MRFFLYGYYGQGNVGDDLLLRSCVLGIRSLCPDARFVVRAGRVATGLDPFTVPFEVSEVDEVLADQTRSRLSRLVSALAAYRNHLRNCDWLVFGGGTLFHERPSPMPLVLLLMLCLMARAMGVRIAALGVGIAELKSRRALAALKGIVALSEVFAVRDEAALEQCHRAGAFGPVLTSDLAFTLASACVSGDVKRIAAAGPTIGISVYPPAIEEGEAAYDLRSALQEVVLRLQRSGYAVRLLAFHHASDGGVGDDEAVLARLVEDIPVTPRPPVVSVTLARDTSLLASSFDGIDLICGMRFHGHVLAAIYGIPFVGIAADNKINAICRLFDMPILPIDRLTADKVVAAIAATLSRKPDRGLVDRAVAQAHQNFSLFADALAQRRHPAKTSRP